MKRTFVDRGGTFTDVVQLQEDGRVTLRKIPSDRAVVGELSDGPLTFGTTVATNALLERKGVPTLLIVNEGFADLHLIGDQARPDLFDEDRTWPPSLATLVAEVKGRIDAEGGELTPLHLPELSALDQVEAVAIVLINSHRNPAHELALAEHMRKSHPHLYLALGHRLSPELGYLARLETALVDAAITPRLKKALKQDRIGDEAMAMKSDAGLCPAADLGAADAVLSGPAGGVLAVAAVARQAGFEKAVGLDMGGTSTDVCRVDTDHLPRREGEVRIAGVRLRRPMVDVETIAAGGGSLLKSDGLRLQVGPESAGADPGPACYRRGGPQTLTDAALAAGLIDPSAFDPPLDPAAVDLPAGAEDFLAIARESMAQAIARVGLQRGTDVRDHPLVAYGGAAGQHGAAVAERLGIKTVLVHPCASVLSAWGQALARREETAVQALWRPFPEAWEEILAAVHCLQAQLPCLGEEETTLELRHTGTDHPLPIALSEEDTPETVLQRFAEAHHTRFGFSRAEQRVEVVNVRLRVRAPLPKVPTVEEDPWGIGGRTIEGPALLTTDTTAIQVPEGWQAKRKNGLLWLEHGALVSRGEKESTERTPLGVELWGNRFMGVAKEAGETLRRLARSVNIRERLDFSCALFDGSGRLVANAPHMPVHLGAMGETVRDLLRAVAEPEPGQAYLCNDPQAGGSHLPDLTVVTPVRAGTRLWFVASRGHHVDVGGLTPGSMPPHSTSLREEGFVVRNLPLLQEGHLADIRPHLQGCRQPETVLADLEAQVAANAHAAKLLTGLGPPEVVQTWMQHLYDASAEAVARVIDSLEPAAAADSLAGVPLRLSLKKAEGRLQVDFSGTGGPHGGNLNAPRAVVRAAVLFALRVMVGRDIPLNEGALSQVRITVPEPSLLSPPPEAAVVGGNVETSQRLVDLFLTAAGYRASSQGTMNNLTLGGKGWSHYETIGGGLGASVEGPGVSGRQVHMTNTRSTDVEVIEARLPLRVHRIGLRRGSGGAGHHPGGDGAVREIEALEPLTVSLLATRRQNGAPGLSGGEPGLPGKDQLFIDEQWQDWDGSSTELHPGDRVRIATPGGGGWGKKSPT